MFNRNRPRTALDDLMDEHNRPQNDSIHSDESDSEAPRVSKPSTAVVKKRNFTFSKKKPVYATLDVEENYIPSAQPTKYTLHTSQIAGVSKGNMRWLKIQCHNASPPLFAMRKIYVEDLYALHIFAPFQLSGTSLWTT